MLAPVIDRLHSDSPSMVKSVFGTRLQSAGRTSNNSCTVDPNALGYCSVQKIGISKATAPRTNLLAVSITAGYPLIVERNLSCDHTEVYQQASVGGMIKIKQSIQISSPVRHIRIKTSCWAAIFQCGPLLRTSCLPALYDCIVYKQIAK